MSRAMSWRAQCACHGQGLPDPQAAAWASAASGCAHGVESQDFLFHEPLELDLLSNWLGSIAFFHGPQVLQLRGLVHIQGEGSPFEIAGLRQAPRPLVLASPPNAVSHLVFLTRGLPRATIEDALARTPQALAGAAPH